MTDGWRLQLAGDEDTPLLARLLVQGWRDSYGGIVDQAYLDGLAENGQAERWRQRFAEKSAAVKIAFDANGVPAGFVGYGRLRTPLPGQSPIRPLYSGEVYAIYILAAYWRQGLGRRLMREAATGLAAMKHRSVCLWVIGKNQRAVEFYKALGGQRCGRQQIEIGAQRFEELAFGWRDGAKLL